MTYDKMAVGVLLGPGSEKSKQARLTNLAKQASDRLENRVECPECGSMGPHDDNNQTGASLSYCCTSCGSHFDAESV